MNTEWAGGSTWKLHVHDLVQTYLGVYKTGRWYIKHRLYVLRFWLYLWFWLFWIKHTFIHTKTGILGEMQNGRSFSGDVWVVDELVGGAHNSCDDWLVSGDPGGDPSSSSSINNLSIVNTGASEERKKVCMYI